MAIGAVFVSLPVAFFGALYVSALHGLEAGQGLIVYATLGALSMSILTLGYAQRVNQPS